MAYANALFPALADPTRRAVLERLRAGPLSVGEIARGLWWPKSHHVSAVEPETVVIEPHPGGRWFERAPDGAECDVGKVLAWEPPARLLLAWQLDANFRYQPDLVTEVEVRFIAEGDA